MAISRGGGGYGPPATASAPTPTGLIFPSNATAGSDIRLVWDGSILLPRTSHTVIWRANYVQQTGYYAVTWHSPNTGTWDNGEYSVGMHPFPCDGGKDSNGQATGGTGGSGTVHYEEIAGLLGAYDRIASPSSPGPQDTFLVTKGVWYLQARVVELSGTTLTHTFYPDVENNPTKFIRQSFETTNPLWNPSPANPAFYFGASDWRSNQPASGQNDETPSCTLRGIAMFNAPLSISDIQTEAASTGNTAVTTAGQASVWYINKNPTPTDVTDKSGQGRNPSWANANRPTLYTG